MARLSVLSGLALFASLLLAAAAQGGGGAQQQTGGIGQGSRISSSMAGGFGGGKGAAGIGGGQQGGGMGGGVGGGVGGGSSCATLSGGATDVCRSRYVPRRRASRPPLAHLASPRRSQHAVVLLLPQRQVGRAHRRARVPGQGPEQPVLHQQRGALLAAAVLHHQVQCAPHLPCVPLPPMQSLPLLTALCSHCAVDSSKSSCIF
jgi:hypothetical protein